MLQSHFKRALVLVMALFGELLESSPSWACTCDPNGSVVQVVPEDGAVKVPVNVVPWVRARGTVRLLDPDGNAVELVELSHTPRVTLCIFTRELRPVAPLLPNTTYRVQVDPFLEEDSDNMPESSFTTGDTTLESTEWSTIELNSRVFDATSNRNTCVYAKYQACDFAGQSDELLDVRVFAGEEQAIHYVDFADNLYNVELPDDATCLEVRMRDFAGETSPPARTCFDLDQAPVLTPSGMLTVFPDCQAADFDDRLVPREDERLSGCFLARHAESRSRTPGVAAIVVALGVVFASRRGGRASFLR